MTGTAAGNDPLDLGAAVAPDPFGIQPGSIVLERFCVIGRVRHAAGTWRVLVTDLQRELGAAPHHRLDLHFLPLDPSTDRAARKALGAHQRGGRRADAVVDADGGLFLLASPAEGPALALPLRVDEAVLVARVLSAIVAGTHKAGVVGIRFDLRDLRADAFGGVQFASWRHLLALRSAEGADPLAEGDVCALVDVLRSLGSPVLDRVLADAPGGSQALADRLSGAAIDAAWSPPEAVLPALAPFTGRELELLAVHQAVARARFVGPRGFYVTGPAGSGRTRLLDELALEFARGDDVIAIRASFRARAPTSGLGVLVERVADAVVRTRGAERDATIARIAHAVGPMAGLVGAISARLGQLLGPAPPLPDLALDETFVRHCATAADVLGAIGTPERAVVLLLDDVHRADASVRAVLYHLMSPGRAHPLVVVATGPEDVDLGWPCPPVLLRLEPLPHQALAELLRAAVPGPVDATDRVTTRLVELTQGSPAAAWGRVRSWVETGALHRTEEGRWRFHEPDDPSTSNVLHLPSRWASVSRVGRAAAVLVAARAEPVTPGWLAAVTGLEPAQVRDAVGELAQRGVLVQDPGGPVDFPDDGTRTRLLDDVTPSEVRDAHAAIARWLEGLGGAASAAQSAWHLEHAAPDGHDEPLATLHVAAGRDHLRATNAERAAWHFERAMARAADPECVRAATEGRADARLLQDQVADALADYLVAIERAPNAVDALVLANRAVHAFYVKGAIEAALGLADRALERVGTRVPRGLAAAALDVAMASWTLAWRRRVADGALADQLAMLHGTLVATAATSHPHVGLSSLFRGLAAAVGRTSGEAARAWAFFSVLLVAMGARRWARRWVDEAERVARDDPNPAFLGVVQHFRGQNELALGNYAAGQEAFRSACATFRLAGDLSVGVISMGLSIFYSLDRDPAPVLLDRIREALGIAWRQRDRHVVPTLEAMRLYVLARCGVTTDELSAAAVAPAEEIRALLPGVLGDSLIAMAVARVSVQASVARAATARARLESATGRPAFLEVALVAEARALLEGGDPAEARRAVKRLAARARRVPAIAVASRMCTALLAIREGDTAGARATLVEVTGQLPTHGEQWHALEAHRLLSELLAGEDPATAAAHRDRADELAHRLGVAGVAPGSAPAAPAEAEAAPVVADLALWQIVEALREPMRKALPASVELTLAVSAGVRAEGDPELAELLVVNLLLAVRDCVGTRTHVRVRVDEVDLQPEEAAALPEARAGRWARIAISADGATGPMAKGALHECHRLCANLHGFVTVREGDGGVEFAAHLPAPHGAPPLEAARLAVVVHRDERTRRTLVDGIRRAGWAALEIPPGEPVPDEAALVLAEWAVGAVVAGSGAPVVPIVRRGERVDGVQLRVPYVVGELDALLRKHR